MPTRDIHMNQVGFEENWLEFIHSYVVPVSEKVYGGYVSRVSCLNSMHDQQAHLSPGGVLRAGTGPAELCCQVPP